MTPQQKAIDLVNMFNSCEYAMICVVEIINIGLPNRMCGYDELTSSYNEFWLEVKEEINKL